MRESRSYGSVRERGGNEPLYSDNTNYLICYFFPIGNIYSTIYLHLITT